MQLTSLTFVFSLFEEFHTETLFLILKTVQRDANLQLGDVCSNPPELHHSAVCGHITVNTVPVSEAKPPGTALKPVFHCSPCFLRNGLSPNDVAVNTWTGGSLSFQEKEGFTSSHVQSSSLPFYILHVETLQFPFEPMKTQT